MMTQPARAPAPAHVPAIAPRRSHLDQLREACDDLDECAREVASMVDPPPSAVVRVHSTRES